MKNIDWTKLTPEQKALINKIADIAEKKFKKQEQETLKQVEKNHEKGAREQDGTETQNI
jgi:TRAP-type C4-dicarboxylate transport system substrate-binding protein